ncbi:hypothetical protein GCK32_019764, partial [Trichostrongylus colubriformis]
TNPEWGCSTRTVVDWEGEILCYDMRMPGTIMFKMLRPFNTNQKTCFDVESLCFELLSRLVRGLDASLMQVHHKYS